MPCYSPLKCGFDHQYNLTFSKKSYNKELPSFNLPCGKCIGCRIDRSREWAIRCVHEAKTHSQNSFITLTYSNENLPLTEDGYPTLFHEDFQKFMKRLRKKLPYERMGFFMCGEYGEQYSRPHYHAILFGVDFPDKELVTYRNNLPVYDSKILRETWSKGHVEIGSVTYQSAAYIGRYVVKKLTGEQAALYDGREPEYGKASKKYAIGKNWLEKWWSDIFNINTLIFDGSPHKIPRYYVKWLEKNQPQAWRDFKTRDLSLFDSEKYKYENSPQRLKAKKIVKQTKLAFLRRQHDKGVS